MNDSKAFKQKKIFEGDDGKYGGSNFENWRKIQNASSNRTSIIVVCYFF